MPVTLRPMDPSRLPAWLERSRTGYIDHLVTTGSTPDDAARHASETIGRMFPDDRPAPGHAVFDVVDASGGTAGFLWIGPDTSADPTAWWVWNIEIDEDRRGNGLGRATMLAGEQYVRSQGGSTLGLNVFGSNTRARALYESLGYATMRVQMRKELG